MSVAAYEVRREIGRHQRELLTSRASPHAISYHIRTGFDFALPASLWRQALRDFCKQSALRALENFKGLPKLLKTVYTGRR
jgi:hypothetical protein